MNGTVAARSAVLSAAGAAAARVLRALGWLRLLARLKAGPRLRRVLFRPAAGPPEALSAAAEAELRRLGAACRDAVRGATVGVGPGVRLRSGRWRRPA